MHILIIHQAFTSIHEPGGTRHFEIACNLIKRGHKVTIIASPISYLTGNSQCHTEESVPGMTILRSYTYSAFHKSFLHRLISFFSFMISSFINGLRVKKVDLVWGTSPPIFQGATAWLLAKLKRIPFLFEVRDLWPEFAIAVGVLKNPILITASRWLERFLYHHASILVVNSPGYIDYVQNRGAKEVVLIPNGVNPDMFFAPDRGIKFRRDLSLEDRFIVVYAGAHGVSNDLGMVLNCAAGMQRQNNIHFLFVGDGKDKPALVRQAAEKNLTNVTFLPPVPKSQMAEVLAAADACLAILKPLECYKTTYPNKVFDYMAASRPVLLAIDGVIKKVVEEAGCGIFVQPGDDTQLAESIRWLQQNPVQARNMGQAGLNYVSSHFHRTVLSQQMAEIIEKVGKTR